MHAIYFVLHERIAADHAPFWPNSIKVAKDQWTEFYRLLCLRATLHRL